MRTHLLISQHIRRTPSPCSPTSQPSQALDCRFFFSGTFFVFFLSIFFLSPFFGFVFEPASSAYTVKQSEGTNQAPIATRIIYVPQTQQNSLQSTLHMEANKGEYSATLVSTRQQSATTLASRQEKCFA